MPELSIRVNLDIDPWTDLQDLHLHHGQVTRIGLLPNGTVGGKATVAVVIETDTGHVVVAETTWALFKFAAAALGASPVATMEDL